MAYLYRHIRLDKNEPFYVGIGSDNSYKRAYSKKGRNTYWQRIVTVSAYAVDIMLEDLTWKQACEKEIEFINLYGRVDLGTGCLVNMTEGGEGLFNPSEEIRQKLRTPNSKESYKRGIETKRLNGQLKHTDSWKLKMSLTKKGKPKSEEHKQALRTPKKTVRHLTCPHCEINGVAGMMKRWHFDNCGKEYKHKEETLAKMKKPRGPQDKLKCPHCFKEGGNVLRRYHFDNCKQKIN